MGWQVTELQNIQSNIAKWAKISYGLMAVYFLATLVGDSLDVTTWREFWFAFFNALLGPLLGFFLFLFIVQRKSRVAALGISIVVVILGIDYALTALGTDPLFFSDSEPDDLDALHVVFCGAILFVGFKIGMELQKFHVAAESRIILRNILYRVLIPLGYLIVALVILVVLRELREDASSGIVATISLIVLFAVFFLNLWRKLPGTGRFPTVVWGDDVKEYIETVAKADEVKEHSKYASFVKSCMAIDLLAYNQRDQDGNYIVSPYGKFAKSYLLSAEQFTAYQEWYREFFAFQKWQQRFLSIRRLPVFAVTALVALFMISPIMLPTYGFEILFLIAIGGEIGFIVWRRLKVVKEFRKAFPDAPIARKKDNQLKRLLFAFAAVPYIGTYTFSVLVILEGIIIPLEMVQGLDFGGYPLGHLVVVSVVMSSPLMIVFGIGVIYARYTFKKCHNRPLTTESLADVEGLKLAGNAGTFK